MKALLLLVPCVLALAAPFYNRDEPRLLVAVQALDGISAAVLGVLVPLTVADIARRSGHFNLAQGAVGCAVGIGASISTTVVGALADRLGSHAAFTTMAIVAGVGLAAVALLMPETRPAGDADGVTATGTPDPGG